MANSIDSKRLVSIIFIIALAGLFALQWGPGSKGISRTGKEAPDDVAATVNGKEIPLREFSRAYAGQLANFRAQGLTADLARQFGLPRQVMDQLVNFELLAQASEARGISASDQEISEQLQKDPGFQKDGKFDLEQYHQVLRDYFRMTDVVYEADLRRRMAAAKMLDLVESGAVVSDDEVKARYLKEGNKADATFVRFNGTMFAQKVTAPKGEEVVTWSKAHEKEIADYYAANQLSYHQPERVRARQILIRAHKEEGEAKQAEAKQKIEGLKKQLAAGQDFAELAKQFSEDTETKEKGGDMGLLERISLPPSLANAVFNLKVGEVTEPIESPLGWHLAKVEEKKAPETRSLEVARPEIAAQLFTREKAKSLARAEAEKAVAALKAGKSLSELYPASSDESKGAYRPTETKPEAIKTGDFNAATVSIPQLGPSADAMKAIFALTAPAPLLEVFEVADGFAVINVELRERPSDAEFEAKRSQMKNEATKAKQFELREAFMKSLKQTGSVVVNDRVLDQISQG
jgi:peptidyl-prolyl cis-trans isomerase D